MVLRGGLSRIGHNCRRRSEMPGPPVCLISTKQKSTKIRKFVFGRLFLSCKCCFVVMLSYPVYSSFIWCHARKEHAFMSEQQSSISLSPWKMWHIFLLCRLNYSAVAVDAFLSCQSGARLALCSVVSPDSAYGSWNVGWRCGKDVKNVPLTAAPTDT